MHAQRLHEVTSKGKDACLHTSGAMQTQLTRPLVTPVCKCASAPKSGCARASRPQASASTSATNNYERFAKRSALRHHNAPFRPCCAASQQDAAAPAPSSIPSLADAPLLPVSGEQGGLPTVAGVYAVYNKEAKVQYIGLSRKVRNRRSSALQNQ